MVEIPRRKLLALGPPGVAAATAGGYFALGLGRVRGPERARRRRERADRAFERGTEALADGRLGAASDAFERAAERYERTETLATDLGCESLATYAAVRQRQIDHLLSAVAASTTANQLRRAYDDSRRAREKIRKNERRARSARRTARQLATELPSSTDCG